MVSFTTQRKVVLTFFLIKSCIIRGTIMRNWPCVRCYYKSITRLTTCDWRAAADGTPPFTSTEAEHFSNCFEHELFLQSFTTVMSSCGVKGVIDIQYRAVSVSFQHCSHPGRAWWWPLRWEHEWYQISQNRKIHGCTSMEWWIFSRRKKKHVPGHRSNNLSYCSNIPSIFLVVAITVNCYIYPYY